MKKTAAILMSACIVALSGCQTAGTSESPTNSQATAPRMVKITAIGHGATSSFDGYTPGQKKLMAMRASKLDAYRSLAEQVYGVRLTGNTTVGAMMVQSDSFRVYIDTTLRGARVQSITPMADGNYETVVEMDFNEAMAREFVARQPQPAAKSTPPVSMTSGEFVKGMSGPGQAYGNTFYYAE
ncbi:MAG: hypothetical protein H6R01_621 [Burkholderiaceae bacterium]|nr:hypothetical protein [Burkholderiaceae bacterium]